MLWLCFYLPDLALEAFAPPADAALAVFERQGSRRWIVSATEPARRCGVTAGTAVTTAQAVLPTLTLLERQPRREKRALRHLAHWAEQFGSELFFEPERHMLWLEIGQSLSYFGGLESLLSRLHAGLGALGYGACLGVAPTPEAAAWVALEQDLPILQRSELRPRLKHYPLQGLPFAEAAAGLVESGIKTLGDLLRLPGEALARRFGPALPDYLQRLLGERSDTRPRYRAPRTYRRYMEFLGGIESTEGLLFPIRRALTEFQGYLRARDTGVQQFSFEFEHENRPPTPMELRLTSASRDAAHFLVLVRERLERLQLPAPATGLTLRAERFIRPDLHQGDLFDQRLQQDGEWLSLLERLQARLGEDAIRFLGLRAEHLPERAWHAGLRPAVAQSSPSFPERPFWLLAHPQPLREAPRLKARPERIEGGWWDGGDVQRDYYLAETDSGSRLWVYRDAGGGWFMHGLWA